MTLIKMSTVSAQTNWGYAEFQAKSQGRTAHKIAFVSPRIDVDVTGYSVKNVGTQLIDHPRDSGLRRRQQLWEFQNKYRGTETIQKFRTGWTDGTGKQKDNATSDDTSDDEDIKRTQSNMNRNSVPEAPSLSSRLQKRLKQRSFSLTGFRPPEMTLDLKSRHKSANINQMHKEKQTSEYIEPLDYSELTIKNLTFDKTYKSESEDASAQVSSRSNNSRSSSGSSKISEPIHKLSPTLGQLPDIQNPWNKAIQQQPQPIRIIRPYSNNGNTRVINQILDKRTPSLQRSLTIGADLGPSKIKLRLAEKRREDEQYTSGSGKLSNDGDSGNRSDSGYSNEDDECDGEDKEIHAEHMYGRECGQTQRAHIVIRHHLIQANTEDEIENTEIQVNSGGRSEQSSTISTKEPTQNYTRADLRSGSNTDRSDTSSENERAKESSTKLGTNNTINRNKNTVKGSEKRTVTARSNEEDTETESDDGLDMPEDRFGPTTHSVDKKLSIRKPWEWKPSPYRWIDRDYVKESDKPYIERILNAGEIIDEFDYDSFARTKPLKLQKFPEKAGYKDRYGVLR